MRASWNNRRLAGPVGTALLAVLAGCATDVARDPTSRYYLIPLASVVVVRAPIPIAPDSARAFIQDGRVVPQGAIRRYAPFCEFEVNTVADFERPVLPGRFQLKAVVREQIFVGRAQPTLLAALGGVQVAQGTKDGGDRLAFNAVRFLLGSESQPDVRELRCTAGWSSTVDVVFPTVAEMRRALGDLIALEMPATAP